MEFRFKQFCVSNSLSAMKVNTDGVLLGAAMTLGGNDRRLLDIGTGTGTVALMAAQRLSGLAPEESFLITGIDIDRPSAAEAAANFANSPWSGGLESVHISLKDYASEEKFDRIFSNPPYFDNSISCKDPGRNAARHCESMSYRDIAEFAASHLADNGTLTMIIDSREEKNLLRYAAMCELFPSKAMYIRTVPRKNPCRIIVEFSAGRRPRPEASVLDIRNDKGDYTQEYVSLTKDFYLFF